MIFTHWQNSMHKDHITTSKIVVDASFFAGIDMGDKLEGNRHFAPVYFAENWEDADGYKPYLYNPLSDEAFKLWSDAIPKHWYIMNLKLVKYYHNYTHISYARGALARNTHAQYFAVFEYHNIVIN